MLVPSAPMKEERLSTAGSWENYLREFHLLFGHGFGADAGRGLGNALDDAGVLNGEEALGDVGVEKNGEEKSGERREKSDGLKAENDFEGAP